MRVTGSEARIAAFAGKYAPEIADVALACRRKLRQLVPRGFELVYDSYNALVFAFGPTEKSSDAVCSIAAYPRWVTLFFMDGTRLDDPAGLLQGTGSRIRSVRLGSAADLDRKDVRALIAAALASAKSAFAGAPPLATTIKSVSAKQRARRPSGPKALVKKAARGRSVR